MIASLPGYRIIAMAHWTYRCYIDGGDPNLWQRGYDEQSKAYRARHDATFEFLEARQEWREPNCKYLSNCGGLLEIKFSSDGIQHRVFGFHDPGFTFIVVGLGNHKQNVYAPKRILATSCLRMSEIREDKAKAKTCDRPR